ncbi:MAG: hypothetical protein JRF33_03580 [Deltaproteobacteria bacterium]|nr:hypothetical protein [Deltaproteobacteria bacterium]
MSKKKGKRKQAPQRNQKRKSSKSRGGQAGSAQGFAKKTGDIYHIRSQVGLSSLFASGRPTLVDFWAPWCQPCLRMGPIFERIAARYGDQINFAKVDTEALPKVGGRYGVKSIPTIIAFSGRKEASRSVGLLNEQRMKHLAESLLPDEEEEDEEIVDTPDAAPAENVDAETSEEVQGSQESPIKSGGFLKRLFGGKKG